MVKEYTNEIWKPVRGYEGMYEVSNYGNVRSMNYNHTGEVRNMKTETNKNGYKQVNLCKDGKQKLPTVHRLVAQAFLPNPENLPQVNHINENKSDNRVENLEWTTREKNVRHGTGIQRSAEKRSKKVNQYTLDGELVKEWVSTMEVQKQTGWANQNISACCRGMYKTAYGFIWQYV